MKIRTICWSSEDWDKIVQKYMLSASWSIDVQVVSGERWSSLSWGACSGRDSPYHLWYYLNSNSDFSPDQHLLCELGTLSPQRPRVLTCITGTLIRPYGDVAMMSSEEKHVRHGSQHGAPPPDVSCRGSLFCHEQQLRACFTRQKKAMGSARGRKPSKRTSQLWQQQISGKTLWAKLWLGTFIM